MEAGLVAGGVFTGGGPELPVGMSAHFGFGCIGGTEALDGFGAALAADLDVDFGSESPRAEDDGFDFAFAAPAVQRKH